MQLITVCSAGWLRARQAPLLLPLSLPPSAFWRCCSNTPAPSLNTSFVRVSLHYNFSCFRVLSTHTSQGPGASTHARFTGHCNILSASTDLSPHNHHVTLCPCGPELSSSNCPDHPHDPAWVPSLPGFPLACALQSHSTTSSRTSCCLHTQTLRIQGNTPCRRCPTSFEDHCMLGPRWGTSGGTAPLLWSIVLTVHSPIRIHFWSFSLSVRPSGALRASSAQWSSAEPGKQHWSDRSWQLN